MGDEATSTLQSGEQIRDGADFPGLTWFQPGDRRRPLIVFLTGGGVLARVAYGYPGGRPTDFLAHWIGQAGHPFLALSYPMDHPVFPSVYPGFSVRDWGNQSAVLVEATLREHGLAGKVVALGWSMAGRVAHAFATSLRDRQIGLELFIGLAAGAPLPNLFPALDQLLKPAASGLADGGEAYRGWLLRNLREQERLHGRAIIPENLFQDQFLADFPVNLAATALRYRPTCQQDGCFTPDMAEDLSDTAAFDYDGFPLVALLVNGSAIEDRHPLTDRGAWSLYQSQTLYRHVVLAGLVDVTALPTDRWLRLHATIANAPTRLEATVPGGHLFFVGEQGASVTVVELQRLRNRARRLRQTIQATLLAPSVPSPG